MLASQSLRTRLGLVFALFAVLFLVNAGFVPETITQSTQDLEQVFLELTNSGTGGVQ